MSLEDAVILIQYPIAGLLLLSKLIQEEIGENKSLFSKNNNMELYHKLMGLTEISIAAAKHLENLRSEFREEVIKQFS